MANKILLEDRNYSDMEYEPSDSEDEYTEREKTLLKKVRQKRKTFEDKEKELLPFDESDDTEDDEEDDTKEFIDNSDFEEEGDDNIPDSRAWGKRAGAYYHTDFVDQDYSTYTEKEEELAQQEEEEAKQIQLRLAKHLDEADFTLDTFADESVEQAEEKTSTEILKADFSNLSVRQKMQLFQQDSPEFPCLVQDFKNYFEESCNLLSAVVEFASKEKDLKLPLVEFARLMNNLILTYCTNISFYLLLKSKRMPIKNHPVVKRLVQLKKLLEQLKEKYNVVKPQLQALLQAANSGVDIVAEIEASKLVRRKLKMTQQFDKNNTIDDYNQENEDYSDDEMISKNNLMRNGENLVNSDEDQDDDSDIEMDGKNEENDGERRGITYQIAKNKGLTPHRKKELRNPRVKHRNKYRKALIRRKGAVRTVRKEYKRYTGEISGIKANVKKGIKIKS